MALVRFKEYYPNYKETFNDSSIAHLDSFKLYSENDEQIGTVKDALVDEQTGKFRYLIVDTGFWIFGKDVLLPVGLGRYDYNNERIYVNLTKDEVESLPAFSGINSVDADYEESLRRVYRPTTSRRGSRQSMEQGYAVNGQPASDQHGVSNIPYNRSNYDYRQDPALYNVDDTNAGHFRLYEERLIADKHRNKAGEVRVGKHVETDTARVSVPVTEERVIVERNAARSDRPVTGTPDFREGEVARMDVYEETADIKKQPFVREEVNVRKEVTQKTVDAEEQVRREELDVDTKGRPNIDRR